MNAAQIAADLLAQLDDAAMQALAERLRPWLEPPQRRSPQADAWLDTKRAAVYLGISPNALHKLTAARAIPFEQEGARCKCWFKRSELDAWRRGEGGYAAKAQPRSENLPRVA